MELSSYRYSLQSLPLQISLLVRPPFSLLVIVLLLVLFLVVALPVAVMMVIVMLTALLPARYCSQAEEDLYR